MTKIIKPEVAPSENLASCECLYSLLATNSVVRNNDRASYPVLRSIASGCAKNIQIFYASLVIVQAGRSPGSMDAKACFVCTYRCARSFCRRSGLHCFLVEGVTTPARLTTSQPLIGRHLPRKLDEHTDSTIQRRTDYLLRNKWPNR